MKVSLVRLFLIAALMLSGVSLLPSMPRPPAAPAGPAVSPADGWNNIVVTRDALGQYRLQASVNGAPIEFMIDTGASHVVLAQADAARAGLRAGDLRFTGRAATANGEVALAPVMLREVRIGQFSRRDVPAMVNEAPMSVSLLGMSFLSSL